jgi:hypothetical protein
MIYERASSVRCALLKKLSWRRRYIKKECAQNPLDPFSREKELKKQKKQVVTTLEQRSREQSCL